MAEQPLFPDLVMHCCTFLGRSIDGEWDLLWCNNRPIAYCDADGVYSLSGTSGVGSSKPLTEAFLRAGVEGLVDDKTYRQFIEKIERYEYAEMMDVTL